ncbi:uracil phosphoribosyltransferase [Oscillatoria amoena NRMC-F 0135]|nr:uracil phosphoribosyltransferase [Oscillatoria amoena NRMC-F 0135]
MLHILNQQASVANSFLAELRDKSVQQDRERFRINIERLGEMMAYEISKKLEYTEMKIETPLGTASVSLIRQEPVLITVLRAGLPYFCGFQRYFTRADCGFIGAARKENGEEISIALDYLAAPNVDGRPVILVDPMLATGKSFVKSVHTLKNHGKPSHIHVASLVAAPEGVAYIKEKLKPPHTIWTWALDEKLNARSYIVPGLGDAGDLCYGEKL